MKYLLTGSTGFLGSYIKKTLIGEEVYTLGRSECTICADLRNIATELVLPEVDFVVHVAGKAHIEAKSANQDNDIYDTNVLGTRNLLLNLEKRRLPKFFIFISSVAVYGLTTGKNISENSDLLATDSYGKSKIEAESIIIEWAKKHSIKYLILRLPLVAGVNPPGSLGSMINGIKKGFYFNIGDGGAKKSIVMASDIALLIKNLPEHMQNGIYNLTDGYNPTFLELSIHLSKQLGKSNPHSLPYFLAKILSLFGDIIGPNFPINSNKLKKITSDLTFNDSKARNALGWSPSLVLDDFTIT
jgi:nucleoside-diphosphate-sugar epimerase